jgi:hypothetical protein
VMRLLDSCAAGRPTVNAVTSACGNRPPLRFVIVVRSGGAAFSVGATAHHPCRCGHGTAQTASLTREDDHKHPVLIERKYDSNHVDDHVRLNIDQDEIAADQPVSELLGQYW